MWKVPKRLLSAKSQDRRGGRAPQEEWHGEVLKRVKRPLRQLGRTAFTVHCTPQYYEYLDPSCSILHSIILCIAQKLLLR